ncbi:porin [Burkholderia alba]|uniref:porin n=1 Tax=Burkholderia alba TaxID=2683677 RepID=UPI002B05BACD|nr:porin [Burkholderia alba]
MKKLVLIAGVSALFAGAAHAQSSVTLYGVLDAGLVYGNNTRSANGSQSGPTYDASSSAVSNTLFGLRGSEDLGGGLHAIFKLESGFNLQNGGLNQSSEIFGRQAWVGLQSAQYGTLTLGKQYDSVVDYLGPLSSTGTQFGGNLAAHPFDNDNLNGGFGINNAVKFQSANYAGFQAGGLYGLSNAAGGFADNRAYSIGASYANGPLNLAAAYLQIDNPGGVGTNPAGAVSSADGTATFLGQRQRVFGAGGGYAFGPATVGFVWTHTKVDGLTGLDAGGTYAALNGNSLRFDNYEVNARYFLTPMLSVAGAYTFTDGKLDTSSGSAKPKYHTVSLQGDYALSKRTDVYMEGVYRQVSGGDGTLLGSAQINTLDASTTNRQLAVAVGMRHRF